MIISNLKSGMTIPVALLLCIWGLVGSFSKNETSSIPTVDKSYSSSAYLMATVRDTIRYMGCAGDGYTQMVGSSTYNENTPMGMDTLMTANGMDSIVTIILTFNPIDRDTIRDTRCEGDVYSIMVGTTTYNENNPIGNTTLTGSDGCDSIVRVELTFTPLDRDTIRDTRCEGDGYSIMVGTTTYNEINPIGMDTLTGSDGCDSIVRVELTFNPIDRDTIRDTRCEGDGYSIMVGTTTYNEINPTGVDTLTGSDGCDSIVRVELTFTPLDRDTIRATPCEGDGFSLTIGSDIYNEANPTGSTTLTGSDGCDSIITVELTVRPLGRDTIRASRCAGDGYQITVGTDTYNEANPTGSTTLAMQSANGCDSVVRVELTFRPNGVVTSSTPNSVNNAIGQQFAITTVVSNPSANLKTGELLYCVTSMSTADLTSLTVDGSTLSPIPAPPAGQICFDIDSINVGTTKTIIENWTGTSCSPGTETIRRHLRCVCDAAGPNCNVVGPSSDNATSISAVSTANPLTLNISGPADDIITPCGAPLTYTFTVQNSYRTGLPIQDVKAAINIPAGFTLSNIGGGATLNAAGDSIIIGDVAFGQTVTYTMELTASCGVSINNAANFNLDYVFAEICEGVNNKQPISSPNFTPLPVVLNIVDPNIQGNLNPTANVFDAILNERDTLKVPIVQGGKGKIDSFLYYIINPDAIKIQEVLVGGNALMEARRSGDTVFYWVPPSAINNTTGGSGTDPGLFEENETLLVCEVWLATECALDPVDPIIQRGARYGCDGMICYDSRINGEPSSTGISFGNYRPDLSMSWAPEYEKRPACYADTATTLVVKVVNRGRAPAKDIFVRINQGGHPGSIIGSSLEYAKNDPYGSRTSATIGSAVLASSGTPGANGNCVTGADSYRTLTATMQNVDLAGGDSLYLYYQIAFSCDCRSCNVQNIYYSTISNMRWRDRCDLSFLAVNRSGATITLRNRDYDASMTGFLEGESEAMSSGCVRYQVTSGGSSWFNADYPNAYFESVIVAQCGLDLTGVTAHTATGASAGTVNVLSQVDGGASGNDTLIVKTRTNLSNDYLEICYNIDCSEKPTPICPAISNIKIDNYLVTDTVCVSGCKPNVSCTQSMNLTYTCGDCGPCTGIVIDSLETARVNYCYLDANNDNIPDAGGALADKTIAASRRFVSGDTLETFVKGIVQGSDAALDTLQNVFLEFNVRSDQFTILGGELTVIDSNGVSRTCQVLSQMKVSDTLYVTDITPTQLSMLGCSDFDAPFKYKRGDSIYLKVKYAINHDHRGETPRSIEIIPRFYMSNAPYSMGVRRQCNYVFETINQIGIYNDQTIRLNRAFGGCARSNFELRHRLKYGGFYSDEFPFEIRSPGKPEVYTFVKPSEFEFDISAMRIYLYQHSNGAGPVVDQTNIPSQFFVTNGDSLTFLVNDYLNSLNDPRITDKGIDEGFYISFFPKIKGNCKTTAGNYMASGSFTADVDDQVFRMDKLVKDPVSGTFRYSGGPILTVSTPTPSVSIFEPQACVKVELKNISNLEAPFTWLNVKSQTGGLSVRSVSEITATDTTEITATSFGLFQMGTTNPFATRTVEICVDISSCDTQTLTFDAGWDCDEYPPTVEEATCSNPSEVRFTTLRGALSGQLIKPSADTEYTLCDTVCFVHRFSNPNQGAVKDIVFDFTLPQGMNYVPGSFEIGYPAGFSDTIWKHVTDPTNTFGNEYQIDVTSLDDVLNSTGLPGVLVASTNGNVVLVRWDAITDCSYASGSRGSFRTSAKDACDDPLTPFMSRSPRLLIKDAVPEYDVRIALDDISLNPCNMDVAKVRINMEMSAPPGVQTSNLDSIKITLPRGLEYISYAPVTNATNQQPTISTINEQTVLVWPNQANLTDGSIIAFDIDVRSVDVGQQCGATDLLVQSFTKKNITCASSGTNCSISVLSGQDQVNIDIQKPKLKITDLELDLNTMPPNGGSLEYKMTVTNNGVVPQRVTNDLNIELWEDVDANGLLDTAIDQKVTTLTANEQIPASGSKMVMGTTSLPPTALCNVLAVINPEATCACELDASNRAQVRIVNNFVKDQTACSGDSITVGPGAINGYDYEWLSLNGSNLGYFNRTDTTTVKYAADNTTNANIVSSYALRTSYGGCYSYDTVTLTVFPKIDSRVTVNTCNGATDIVIPGPTSGSNFNWSPGMLLSDSTVASPTLPTVSGTTIFTLDYTDANGCPAERTVTVSSTVCAPNTFLGDTVWFDVNKNGLQDMGELGIPNVQVLLYNATNTSDGAHIGTTTTDSNGYYIFNQIPSSNYVVRFLSPDGFIPTTFDTGSDDAIDSDANPATGGRTGEYFLPSGDSIKTIDAGYIPDCRINLQIRSVGECMPVANDQQRQIEVDINWQNAVYTRDFLGGSDTIQLDILGQTFKYTIGTLSGDTSQTLILQADTTTNITAVSRLLRDTACIARDTVNDVTGCVYDLALKKERRLGPTSSLKYGDTITYDITVVNQGQQPLTDIKVNDFNPSGLQFEASLNPEWMQAGDTLMHIITDTLSPGENKAVPIRFILVMASEKDAWTNVSEIFSMKDTLGTDRSDQDIDSTPDADPTNDAGGAPNTGSDNSLIGDGTGPVGGTNPNTDEDDHDVDKITIVDLALTKKVTTPGPYNYGDTLTFTIDVFNQGSDSVQNVVVNDYIPDGFDWVMSNEPNWALTGTTAKDTVNGPIAPGQSETTSIRLVLKKAAKDQYTNIAEIAYVENRKGENITGDDIDSQADNDPNNDAGGQPNSPADDAINGNGTGAVGGNDATTDEDDADPAYISIPQIELEKSLTNLAPARSGTDGHFDATFQMVITNPGNRKLIMLKLQDDLVEQLGGNFIGITEAPRTVATTDADIVPSIVSGYNGGVIDTIFNGTEGCLEPGQAITVEMVIEVQGMNGPAPIINEANIMGQDSTGAMVSDMDTAVVYAPACYLSVTCPNPNQGILACVENVPAGATSEAAFNAIDGFSKIDNKCGPITITFSDTNNGGKGCIGDTLVITRRYIITDMGVSPIGEEKDTCDIVYRIVDDVKPIIMIPPSDLTVDCADPGAAALITNWLNDKGGARIMENCSEGYRDTLIPVGNAVVECAGAFVQEYLYTATDSCGNSISEKAYLRNVGGEIPDPDFDFPEEVCWDGVAGSLTLTPNYRPSNGTTAQWTLTASSANTIDANTGTVTVNAAGRFEICVEEVLRYGMCATVAADSCVRQYCDSIVIVNSTTLNPSWSTVGPYCQDDAAIDLDALITGNTGGIFSGTGVSGTHPNYTFTPSAAGPGTHSICYTLTTAEGCTAVQCNTIEVSGSVSATIDDLSLNCGVSRVGQISLNGLLGATTSTNGTFAITSGNTVNGAILGGNVLQYNEPGCYPITYTVSAFTSADGACTATDNAHILIPEHPTPSFALQDAICLSAGDAPVTLSSTIQSPTYTNNVDRTWSINSANLTNATASVSTSGQVTVTPNAGQVSGQFYVILEESITNTSCGNNAAKICSERDSVLVSVMDGTNLDACFALSDTTPCLGDTIVLTANTNGGVFSGVGVIDSANGRTASLVINSCGPTAVTYTITTANGCTNSCTINIKADETKPVISMPNDTTFECNGMGNTSEIQSWLDRVSATANCNTPLISKRLFNTVSQCGNTRDYVYEIIATDTCGNTATQYGTVSIADTTKPTINVPSDLNLDCQVLSQIASPALLIKTWCDSASATDACGGPISITHDFSGTALNVCIRDTITVVFTATDACGNVDIDSSRVIINPDETAPVVEAPNQLELDCNTNSENNTLRIIDWLNSATVMNSGCDSARVTHDYVPKAIDFCGTDDTLKVKWTAMDVCGFSHSDSSLIIFKGDNTPPVVSAPDSLRLNCNNNSEGNSLRIIQWLNGATVTDGGCDSLIVTHDFDTPDSISFCGINDTIQVKWTAVDVCGLSHTDSSIVVFISDNTPPEVQAPTQLELDCNTSSENNTLRIISWLNDATVTDGGCDSLDITHDYNPKAIDFCGTDDTIQVKWTAVDVCGFSHTDSSLIIFRGDNTPPVVNAPDSLRLNCNNNSEGNSLRIIQWLNGVTVTDGGCDSLSVTHDFDTPDSISFCGVNDTIQVKWTAVDVCGLSHTDSSIVVFISDNTPPEVQAPTQLELDCNTNSENNTLRIISWLNDATVTDGGCDSLDITHDYEPKAIDFCGTDDTIKVKWTAMDVCGFSHSDSSLIIFKGDNTPPVVSAPDSLRLNCNNNSEGNSLRIIQWLNGVTVTDGGCDSLSVTHDFETPDSISFCGVNDTIQVKWTAVDVCGLSHTDSSIVVFISDNTPPEVQAPTQLELDCNTNSENNTLRIISWLNDATVTDGGCDSLDITHDYEPKAIDFCGTDDTIQVKWTAMDVCGFSHSDSSLIIFKGDNTPPVVSAPDSLRLNCNNNSEGNSLRIIQWLNGVTVTDGGCDSLSVTHDFETPDSISFCGVNDTIQVKWTAVDACGLSHTDSSIVVFISDNTPPEVQAPTQLELDCNTNSENNTLRIISWLNDATVTDGGCDSLDITHDYEPKAIDFCGTDDTIKVKWTAMDVCGFSHSDSSLIIFKGDNTPPVVSAPDSLRLNCNNNSEGNSLRIIQWLNGATVTDGGCDSLTVTHDFDTPDSISFCGVNDTIQVKWTAVDVCGLSHTDSSIVVFISDNTPPEVQAPTQLELDCNTNSENNTLRIISWLNDATVTDGGCDSLDITHDYEPKAIDFCGTDDTIQVKWTAMDVCGFSHSDSSLIIFKGDNTPPVVSAPDSLRLNCNNNSEGNSLRIIQWLNGATVTDGGCDSLSVTHDFETPDSISFCGVNDTIQVKWTAVDVCGLSHTDSSIVVFISDNTPPEVSAPADLVIECSSNSENSTLLILKWLNSATVTDGGCDTLSVQYDYQAQPIDYCNTRDSIKVKWSAMDVCGHSHTDSAYMIFVPDTQAPMITAPDDLTIDCGVLGNGDASLIIDSLIATTSATDNCDTLVRLSHTYSSAQLNLCADTPYDIDIVFTALDACGNQDRDTTTISIVPDTVAPMAVCNPDFALTLGSLGSVTIDLDMLDGGSFDNCVDTSRLVRKLYRTKNGTIDDGVNGQSFTLTQDDLGVNAFSLVVEDLCGNADTCTVNIRLNSDPGLGLSKRVVSLETASDGTADILYEFNIQNYGDVDIDSIQLTDSLNGVFDPCRDVQVKRIYSDDFTVNTGYNGFTNTEMLLGYDQLKVGDKGAVYLELEVGSCGVSKGPYKNSATTTGKSPDGTTLMDISQDGSNPDPDNNGPGNNSDSTEVRFGFESNIGVAKSVNAIQYYPDGSTDITYRFTVENFGSLILDSITLKDNLAGVFDPCTSVSVVPNSVVSSVFEVNPMYNGMSDIELLNRTVDNKLNPGERGTVFMTVNISGCGNDPDPFLNQAQVVAKDAAGSFVRDDFSTDGNDPDPDGNNDPTDNNVRTPVDIGFNPAIGIAKRVAKGPTLRDDGCFDITYEVKVKNYGDLAVTDLRISDNLITTFAGADSFYVVGATSEELDINPAYDGGVMDGQLLTGKDTLNIQFGEGEEASILIDVVVCESSDSATYNNQAVVMGTALNGTLLTDLSTNGSDPNVAGNGPNADSTLTPVTLGVSPAIELKKRVSQGPIDNGDGTFDISYEIRVENTGNIPVQIDSLIDSLSMTFADAASWEVIRLESQHFDVNTAYDGISDNNLISQSEKLNVGDAGAVYVGVRVAPGTPSASYVNKAATSGQSLLGSGLGIAVGDTLAAGANAPVMIGCQNTIICPAYPDTIVQQNDAGWCLATVNFPLAEPDTCQGTGAIQFEYFLTGAGSPDQSTGQWINGQPAGLRYNVGATDILIRYNFQLSGTTAYSDTCRLHVEVVDKEAPILMGGLPEDFTLDHCLPWDTFHLQQHHLWDNCADSLYITEEVRSTRVMDPEDCGYYNYTDTLVWTVTDSAKVLPDGTLLNTVVWKQVVTRIDTCAPEILLPPDLIVTECLPDTTFNIVGYKDVVVGTTPTKVLIGDIWTIVDVVQYKKVPIVDTALNSTGYGQALASDKCTPDSVIAKTLMYRDSVEVVCKGDKEAIIHRIWTASDPCGNMSTAIQKIIVVDKNPPEIECVDSLTVSLNANGEVVLTQSDVLLSVSSACYTNTSQAEIKIIPNTFNCNDIGEHRVLISASDLCGGETSYCEVRVTIVDTVAPVLNCPTDTIIIDRLPDNCAIDIPQLNNLISGNADCDVTITATPPLFANGLPLGIHKVNVLAVDASGNRSQCEVSVDVRAKLEFPESLSCLGKINLGLGPDCTGKVSQSMLFLGPSSICPNFLCMEIRDEFGNIHPNFFDLSDDGQEFTVSLKDCNGSDNSCWGKVRIEVTPRPIIDWPDDVDLLCVEPNDPSYHKAGVPEALNCVTDWSYTYSDNYLDYDICEVPRARIERVWTVVDKTGRTQVDTQYINIKPFSTDHLLWPNDITIRDPLSCWDVEETRIDIENNLISPTSLIHPDSTGKPSIFGIPLRTNAGICLFAMRYEDRVFDICEGSYQILREWEVLNVCEGYQAGKNPLSHTQVITVYDNKEPTIISGPDSMTVSIDPWRCTFNGTLPLAEVQDSCSGARVRAYISNGGYCEITQDSLGNYIINAVNATMGDHRVTYVFEDSCNNIQIYNFALKVVDQVPPTIVTEDKINLSLSKTLGSDGNYDISAKVYKNAVEIHTSDQNCSSYTSCLLLDEERSNPIIRDSVHLATADGELIYHPSQCDIDGVYRYVTYTKNDSIVEEIPYVVCKDFIKFCCENVGENKVALLATDEHGNSSYGWTTVTVADKTPVVECEELIVSCGASLSPDSVGYPKIYQALCDQSSLRYEDDNQLTQCGGGYLDRRWYSGDNELCTQRIRVDETGGFDPMSIKWPVHIDGDTYSGIRRECEDNKIKETTADITLPDATKCTVGESGAPAWCATECALIVSSFKDLELSRSEQCSKIVRRWTVIDWCVYKPNVGNDDDYASGNDKVQLIDDSWLAASNLANTPAGAKCETCKNQQGDSLSLYYRYTDVDRDGYYTFEQVIKIEDDVAPNITVPTSANINITSGAISKNDNFSSCVNHTQLTAKASDYCGEAQVNASTVEWNITATTPSGEVIKQYSNSGDSISIITPSMTKDQIVHMIWKATDACGNSSVDTTLLYYKDAKSPTPICIQDVSTATIEADGSTVLWAADFDNGSFDNCGGVTPYFEDQNGELVNKLTLTCDDLVAGIGAELTLKFYVVDESGNSEYCNISLTLNDDGDACPDDNSAIAAIGGEIRTAHGDMVEDAKVGLNSGAQTDTDTDGQYAFRYNLIDKDYNISAELNQEFSNGVTSLDLILMQQNLLGITPFDGPYKVIAADINNDEQITGRDQVELRRLLLGVIDTFAQNKSWRFVDAAQTFESTIKPWPLQEKISVSNLKTAQNDENFIGIKIGDVSGDAIANSTIGKIRDNPVLYLYSPSTTVKKGELANVSMVVPKGMDIKGLQFTLDIDGIDLMSIARGVMDIDDRHIALIDKNTITVVWNDDFTPDSYTSDDEATLFTMVFKANKDVVIADAIEISSRVTPALAYDHNLRSMSLALTHDRHPEQLGILRVEQNEPNPFVDNTSIDIWVPTDQEVTLTVYDVLGTIIHKVKEPYIRGHHTIYIDRDDLGEHAGVIYYKVETQSEKVIKKMIVLD